jgi:hypothetical protein
MAYIGAKEHVSKKRILVTRNRLEKALGKGLSHANSQTVGGGSTIGGKDGDVRCSFLLLRRDFFTVWRGKFPGKSHGDDYKILNLRIVHHSGSI